ncbi:hypothetical protein GCM10007385_15710 [Tateyamaria omphalii]|uniref:GumC family protein n=1 Tax=Tateyamaria omphalii TaxID=299262 RepID=UPI001672F1DC|nr:hypothetical protein [Tateyamaria omphalii]GGX48576.1 hypothetical protein GCM10007385_15710 [Tateyamaria omphalii]
MGPIQSFGDFIGMVLRRFWVMAAVFFLGVVATMIVVVEMTRVYETTAVIEFDTPNTPGGDAGITVQPNSGARQVQLIEQRLMARESLTEIIERYGLFTDMGELTMVERVAALREATTFQQVAAVQSGGFGSDGRLSAMLITVRLNDPLIVADLANEFARRVVDDTFRSVAERTSETLLFFQEQEVRIAKESREIEAQISSFKQRNQEALPEGQEFRRDESQRLQESLLTIEREVQELQRERRVFDTFGTRSVLSTAGLGASADSPVTTLEAELRTLEIELAQARRLLAPTNPDIARLEAQIEVLNGRADALRAEARERFLADIDSQIELLNGQKEIISERLANLQIAMAEAPSVEIELGSLTLELTRVQERYAVATSQLAEAENAQMLIEARQSDSMRLLEPAIVPEFPVGPSRTRTMLLGVGVSGLLALVIGFLLELMNPVLRTTHAVANRTGLMPVVSIPEIRSTGGSALGFGRQLVSAALFVLFCIGVLYLGTQISPNFEAIVTDVTNDGLELLGTASN